MGDSSLALQFGSVTGAVDDLVNGYESLISTLPVLTDRVNSIQLDTEKMAIQLYDRVHGLVDGYRTLDSIASKVPEDLREVVQGQRESIKQCRLLSPADREASMKQNRQLEDLKADLRSIAHERVVMEVLTRPAINNSKVRRTNVIPGASRPSSRQVPATSPSPSQSRILSKAPVTPKSGSGSNEIEIPSYHSPSSVADHPTHGAEMQPTRRPTPTSSHLNKVFTRGVGGVHTVTVPSMRQGSLPEEIRGLKTTPINTAATDTARKRPARSSSRSKVAQAAGAQDQRLQLSEEELAVIKRQLDREAEKAMKNRAATAQQLRTLTDVIDNQYGTIPDMIESAIASALRDTGARQPSSTTQTGSNQTRYPANLDEILGGYRVLPVRAPRQPVSAPRRAAACADEVERLVSAAPASVPKDSTTAEKESPPIVAPQHSHVDGSIPSVHDRPRSFQLVGNQSSLHWTYFDVGDNDGDHTFPKVDSILPASAYSFDPMKTYGPRASGLTDVPGQMRGGELVVITRDSMDSSILSETDTTADLHILRDGLPGDQMLELLGERPISSSRGKVRTIPGHIETKRSLPSAGAMSQQPPAPQKSTTITTIVGEDEDCLFPTRYNPFVSRVVSIFDTPVDQPEQLPQEEPSLEEPVAPPVAANAPTVVEQQSAFPEELVRLLQAVMIGQQETIQNNQALLLSMIQQQRQSSLIAQQTVVVPPAPVEAPSPRDASTVKEDVPVDSGPSASEIAMAVAGAISALVSPTHTTVLPQAAPPSKLPDLDDITHAVNKGVVEGVRNALSLMGNRGDNGGSGAAAATTKPDTTDKTKIHLSSKRPIGCPSTGLLHVRGVGTGHRSTKKTVLLEDVVARDLLDSRNQVVSMQPDFEEDMSISIESGDFPNGSLFDVDYARSRSSKIPVRSAQRSRIRGIHSDVAASIDSEHWYDSHGGIESDADLDMDRLRGRPSARHRLVTTSSSRVTGHTSHIPVAVRRYVDAPSRVDPRLRPKPLVSMVTSNAATVAMMNMNDDSLLDFNSDDSIQLDHVEHRLGPHNEPITAARSLSNDVDDDDVLLANIDIARPPHLVFQSAPTLPARATRKSEQAGLFAEKSQFYGSYYDGRGDSRLSRSRYSDVGVDPDVEDEYEDIYGGLTNRREQSILHHSLSEGDDDEDWSSVGGSREVDSDLDADRGRRVQGVYREPSRSLVQRVIGPIRGRIRSDSDSSSPSSKSKSSVDSSVDSSTNSREEFKRYAKKAIHYRLPEYSPDSSTSYVTESIVTGSTASSMSGSGVHEPVSSDLPGAREVDASVTSLSSTDSAVGTPADGSGGMRLWRPTGTILGKWSS